MFNLDQKAMLAAMLENVRRAENGILSFDGRKQVEGIRHLRGVAETLKEWTREGET